MKSEGQRGKKKVMLLNRS